MAIDYGRLEQLAVRLISENGREVELLRKGDPDPATLWVGGSEASEMVSAIQGSYDALERSRDEIQASDVRFFIADTSSGVAPGDRIRDGAIVYGVVRAALIRPGPTAIVYDVQART